MQYGGCHSPATSYASSYQAEVPSPNMYSIGSVTSNYTGSDADSDSDNCSPDKLRSAGKCKVARIYTLAKTDLLNMLNWGTQWTLVSFLKNK